MSRIGKRPIDLPSGVEASVSGQTVSVKGPKGTREFTATDDKQNGHYTISNVNGLGQGK